MKPTQQQRSFPWPLVLGLAVSISTIWLFERPSQVEIGLSKTDFDYGLAQCKSHQVFPSTKRTGNPRSLSDAKTLFKNALLLNGDGSLKKQDILVQDGVIVQVADQIADQGQVIDVNGNYLTPGLVDMHSHSGLDSWPGFNGNSDTNEFSQVLTPQVRSLDGFNPWDAAIPIINSGGVTTALILPGSSNLMGGEAYAIKTFKPENNRAEHMLLNHGLNETDKWRWMKFACGENPRNKGEQKAMPQTRLGEGWLLRSRFEKARELLYEQDDWCRSANFYAKTYGRNANRKVNQRYPERLIDDTLVGLLRGKVLLNAHCYETYDIEMLVRVSKQFGFKINTFHHALEAWRVADLLAENDIAAAIFADHWGYKKEAYDASTKAAQVLSEAGVKVAFKSDHPVLNSQNLIYEAQKGHHYGLSAELSIQSVTSIPAQRMGQGHRLGLVKAGYDADIVIWNKHPLELGAHPLQVYVDGRQTFKHIKASEALPEKKAQPLKPVKNVKIQVPKADKVFTFVNISNVIDGPDALPGGKVIVVEDGKITCIGSCTTKGSVVDLQGGWVTPGLIAAGVHLGLEEIQQEPGTGSGRISERSVNVNAADGIKVGREYSRMLSAAFKAGVTTAISAYRGTVPYRGFSTIFRTGATRYDKAFVQKTSLPHCEITTQSLSLSEQLLDCRLSEAVEISGSDRLAALLENNKQVKVIYGGQEAWHVADLLKDKTVILKPARCTPNDWFTQRCKVTASKPTALEILQGEGVNVGLSVLEDNFIRGLIWEAGWQIEDAYEDLSEFEKAKKAVALVTWNVANAYGIPERASLRVGDKANFVVYSGRPGSLEARVVLVVDDDVVETETEQL
ncbi:hypothetical protein EDD86DRAFT_212675 [Gorgonomyces haynaldii]|nr:hypothetical protein EDD86DRAFT_212675 [Gorgonomyces haynaldii]